MPHPAILCDIGNVLVHFDFRPAARSLAQASEFPEDEVLHRLEPLKNQLEDGQISDAAFLEAAVTAIGFAGTPQDLAAIWCAIFSCNGAMHDCLQPLVGRLPLYLLSNTSGLHRDYLFRSFDVFQLFSDGVYSYKAGVSKPSPAIFEQAVRMLDLDPAQTLFIDDLAANIAAAQAMGFVTHHYHADHHDHFRERLLAWLPPLPPRDLPH